MLDRTRHAAGDEEAASDPDTQLRLGCHDMVAEGSLHPQYQPSLTVRYWLPPFTVKRQEMTPPFLVPAAKEGSDVKKHGRPAGRECSTMTQSGGRRRPTNDRVGSRRSGEPGVVHIYQAEPYTSLPCPYPLRNKGVVHKK